MPHVRFVDNHHFIFTAGSRLAAQLGMPISTDGMLALLHKGNLSTASTPRILGVDEWAWRRGWRYGTILCDLEKHCPIDLLPDCSRERVAAWLKTIPVSKSSAVIVLIIMPKQPKHVFPMRFRWQTGGVHFKVLPSPVAKRFQHLLLTTHPFSVIQPYQSQPSAKTKLKSGNSATYAR